MQLARAVVEQVSRFSKKYCNISRGLVVLITRPFFISFNCYALINNVVVLTLVIKTVCLLRIHHV